jgi:uncharacterized iron-regulated membrane protein
MRLHIAARKTHKWLGLFIGFQVVIWSLSGLYMTAVHIDIIHGDHLVRTVPPKGAAATGLMDPLAAAGAHQGQGVRLAWVRNQPAYVIRSESGETVVDAHSGAPVPPPTEAEIRTIAAATYTGNDPIASAALISDLPGEIRGRKPPLWRVEFDQWNKPTLYFSPVTGELLTRRHELWRIFDFVWMLHIMDYDERENVNNPLLRTFTWGALLMALSGAWLLLFAFPKKKKSGAAMTVKSIWLRKIHKWIGLVIGLQFLIWAISGAAMALLPMEEVAGGPMSERRHPQAPPAGGAAWPRVQQTLAAEPIQAVTIRTLPQGAAYQVTTSKGIRLFDAGDGSLVTIGPVAAGAIAAAAHPGRAPIGKVEGLSELNLAVREHELPIWRVDFRDSRNSSYFVSGTTGEVLERRNDSWRWWDFFWMLHNMDYAQRTSFNHPLIIMVGFAMGWLAVTGFWLLFRTMWRHDFGWLKRR